MTFIKNIELALLLIESLDSSHVIKRHYPDENTANREKEYDDKHGITEHKYYSLDNGDAGLMHIYKRKGAYEIHHEIQGIDRAHGISGEMVHTKDVNTKFPGTIYKVANNILKSGNAVRIVGNHTNGMFDKYNRMANVLAKRNNVFVSDPKKYTLDSPNSKDYSEITIHNTNPESLLKEWHQSRINSHNKENNYGIGNSQYWLKEPITIDINNIMEDILS